MNILITNDDGVTAKGIMELAEMAREFGNVTVVAPDGPRSGQSAALTVTMPVVYNEIKNEPGFVVYSCSGTPVDCVKLAFDVLCEEQPDLILSGINHGSNAGINVIYSGTMGAAKEGATRDIPSIGFSLCCDHDVNPDFSIALPYFKEIVKKVIANGLPNSSCLNVNAPIGEIKGMKVCCQADSHWREQFVKYATPHGKNFYWMAGYQHNTEPDNIENDLYALDNQMVSIVPVTVDMTDYKNFNHIKTFL